MSGNTLLTPADIEFFCPDAYIHIENVATLAIRVVSMHMQHAA